MELNAAFINDQEMLSRAEPIYLEGYYNLPSLAKSSPLNLPNYNYGSGFSSTSNGPRFMGKLEKYVTSDNKYAYKVTEAAPVKYNFYVPGLERNIESFVLVDTLPDYIAVKEDGSEESKLAVFDPALNPNWVLSEDGKTVTQSKSFDPTTNIYSVADPLYLLFPDLKSGTNVVNEATISLTPHNKGKDETVMENIKSNELTIYTGKYSNEVEEGDPRFSKEVAGPRYSQGDYRTFFYDIPEDRAKIIPFRLRVSSKASLTDLVDVTMTDYRLDPRLYYYGISFPLEDHTAGNAKATIIAYQKASDKMNPTVDTKLFEKEIVMSKANNMVFPENIAKNIDYVQIVLDKTHKIFSAIEVQVDTKLREPDKAHFVKAGESGSNIYQNYAVMSGNLYRKNTDDAVSKRTDPIQDKKGVTISSYSTDWDNLPGNYLWGEHAEVQIRDYHAQIGFRKTQTYSTARAIEPEETGSYELSLIPRIYSSNGASQYGVGLLYDLDHFEMIDLMPKGVEITDIILSDGFEESGGDCSIMNNYKNTGRSAIIFKTEKLNKGVYNIATIKTKIGLDAPEGFITNEAFVTFATEKDTDGKDKIEKYAQSQAEGKRNFDLKISDEQSQKIFLNVKPIYGRIEIEKVNGSGKAMQYIKFALQEKNAQEGEYFRQGTTDINGKLVFENIIEGEYTLLELPVTAGTKVDYDTSYQPIDPIKITIDQKQQEYIFTGDRKLINEDM